MGQMRKAYGSLAGKLQDTKIILKRMSHAVEVSVHRVALKGTKNRALASHEMAAPRDGNGIDMFP
jgi:hypothetical protein